MLDEEVKRQALFDGLVYNELGQPARLVYVGGEAHYAIPDAGFLRHVEARKIDSAVLADLQAQITSQKDEVVQGMLQLLGKRDIFTKAAIDASLRNFEGQIRQADSTQWVSWLRLFGFRVVVDVHGDVVQIIYPEQPEEGE